MILPLALFPLWKNYTKKNKHKKANNIAMLYTNLRIEGNKE
uniref:Uncharacterized protein n=1 Tax=Anguilla anguilla TaxID=7936 RepID=A0A0E9S712_ANGAN